MNRVSFLIAATLLIADPIRSSAQELNSWGDAFSCAVDWFGVCKEKRPDDSDKQLDPRRSTSSLPAAAANLPLPVRNVLENPSPESARAYVLWSRQTSEKLAKASEYIAQATHEINSEASMFSTENKRGSDLALAGMGPVGLYYFFSPGDRSAVRDVAALNKILSDGKIGVVGIPVAGNDQEVARFVNEVRPLFPIRSSDREVQLVKPAETPDLYLALPLEKKLLRLGSTISEAAITEAIGSVLAGQSRGKPSPDSVVDR